MVEDLSAGPVKKLVQQAIDIATEVPEPFRVAVFSKVFDLFANSSEHRLSGSNAKNAAQPAERNSTNDERARKSRSSTGAKGMASQLIEAGFFDEARTVEAVAEHVSLNFARSFASKDLSTGLIRLVRDGRLRREKTEEGKLGYRKS
jgi:hypothetical protein